MTRGPSPSGNSAKPLHATQRTPGSSTDGPQVAAIADLLGTPLMPWQRLAADVALERDETGAYRHKIVVISVPRQSGKTTLLRAIAVQKMLAHRGRETYFTAQTGKDARARWEQLVELIETDPNAGRQFSVRKSAGSAAIVHRRTRSKFLPFAPTPASLHGYTPHDVMIDEAWEFSEVEGALLMGAIIPAQSTIKDRQLYIVSTKGTAESVFFHDWIDAGRSGRPGVALIEYAAADGVDAYDPASWPTFHPAHGITIDDEVIADAAASLSRSEFERAYANRPTTTAAHLIPPDVWLRDGSIDDQLRPPASWSLTYDVSHDGSSATLRATWELPDGRHATRVLERQLGYSWLPDAVRRWVDSGSPTSLVADDGGLAREVNAHLLAGPEQYRPQILTSREFSTACSSWLEKVRAGDYVHDGDAATTTGVYGLHQRLVGDSWVFSRRHSIGDTSGPISAAIGTFAVTFATREESRPIIAFA